MSIKTKQETGFCLEQKIWVNFRLLIQFILKSIQLSNKFVLKQKIH